LAKRKLKSPSSPKKKGSTLVGNHQPKPGRKGVAKDPESGKRRAGTKKRKQGKLRSKGEKKQRRIRPLPRVRREDHGRNKNLK